MIDPTIAVIHIQTRTPGPPWWIAIDTPAMFPSPTVAANTADNAWNLEIPFWDWSLDKRSLKALFIFNNGLAFDWIVR